MKRRYGKGEHAVMWIFEQRRSRCPHVFHIDCYSHSSSIAFNSKTTAGEASLILCHCSCAGVIHQTINQRAHLPRRLHHRVAAQGRPDSCQFRVKPTINIIVDVQSGKRRPRRSPAQSESSVGCFSGLSHRSLSRVTSLGRSGPSSICCTSTTTTFSVWICRNGCGSL